QPVCLARPLQPSTLGLVGTAPDESVSCCLVLPRRGSADSPSSSCCLVLSDSAPSVTTALPRATPKPRSRWQRSGVSLCVQARELVHGVLRLIPMRAAFVAAMLPAALGVACGDVFRPVPDTPSSGSRRLRKISAHAS